MTLSTISLRVESQPARHLAVHVELNAGVIESCGIETSLTPCSLRICVARLLAVA